MYDKFFMVYVEGESSPTFKYTSKRFAEVEANSLANEFGKKVFVLESNSMATPDKINIKVDSYEAALEYVERMDNDLQIIHDATHPHARALRSLVKLFTIAEAWNKADNFIPDFSNRNQYKWFPWFVYNTDNAGFVYADTYLTASSANVAFGSRLCFKTEERAAQFGKQFIDLWNDFLLFK